MSFKHRGLWALALAAAFTLAACGGGDAEKDVEVTELPTEDQYVLSGDWPLDTSTRAFLVRNDEEWAQAWADRKAQLQCGTATPYNDLACAADAPPAVDFSKYSLVGLLIHPVYFFDSPSPAHVFADDDNRKMVVEYAYHHTYKVPYYFVTGTRFFLVPKTEFTLKAMAKDTSV